MALSYGICSPQENRSLTNCACNDSCDGHVPGALSGLATHSLQQVLAKVLGTRLCSVCLYCASAYTEMPMCFRCCDHCKNLTVAFAHANSLHCSTQGPLCRKSFNAKPVKTQTSSNGTTSSLNVVILHCSPCVHTIFGEAKDRECNVPRCRQRLQ